MFRIKKLYIFITKSFLSLFLGTFVICLFIFLMQFLWRWVDDLVGKGLGIDVLGKFFYYSALTLVPASMPLAVLLASLITFGNFGERFELLAMKAAGISLVKVMRPLMVIVTLLCGVSFYFQNVISPNAYRELGIFALSLKQKSPELDIPEGAFYSDIDGYNLRVMKKNKETGMLYDVLIYDHSGGFDKTRILYADSGRLDMTAERMHLKLQLYRGELFENLQAQSMLAVNVPYRRETFSRKIFLIDFNSGFNMADANVMGSQASAKNIKNLMHSIDSMKAMGDSIGRSFYKSATDMFYHSAPPIMPSMSSGPMPGPTAGPMPGTTPGSMPGTTPGIPNPKNTAPHIKIVKRVVRYKPSDYDEAKLFDKASVNDKQNLLQRALNSAQNVGVDWEFKSSSTEQLDYSMRRHWIELNRKYTIALSCLLFFFIGAPLGGIIRKGGLGMPVVISVLIFIVYYIIDNSGYKMARDGKWAIWFGVWLSTAILAPLGAFLTYKSDTDSVVMNIDTYVEWIKKICGIRSVRHVFMKEVIIHDPDYIRLSGELAELAQRSQTYVKTKRLRSIPNYFKLWMTDRVDNEIDAINAQMESIVEEMSNTRSRALIHLLNQYPVIPTRAHTRPFHNHWLNMAAGVLVPIGIFFLIRIWAFRIRLNKDLVRIVDNNKKAIEIIEKLKKQ